MRAAPLGPVGAAVVMALFHGFAPRMVARAVPDVWSMAAPAVALQARERRGGRLAADGTVHRCRTQVESLPGAVQGPASGRRRAGPGRPAARRRERRTAVARRAARRLWQAATVLREYRGDGHVAVLTAHGVSGCQAHVLRDAADGSRSMTQAARGFTDDEWAAATTALQAGNCSTPTAA